MIRTRDFPSKLAPAGSLLYYSDITFTSLKESGSIFCLNIYNGIMINNIYYIKRLPSSHKSIRSPEQEEDEDLEDRHLQGSRHPERLSSAAKSLTRRGHVPIPPKRCLWIKVVLFKLKRRWKCQVFSKLIQA